MGPSGSGKTTLCSLIARFWDVQEGSVCVGGTDVKDCTADSLLKNLSMVFQNVYLFHDSIENNIKFGNPNATHEQVVEAARRAQCHDFIMRCPTAIIRWWERRLHPLRRREAAGLHCPRHSEGRPHRDSG